ncbi:protein turtle-like [Chrysoperla carnea]|uniref:protein turtle-like n=1 Tax=Chrysoperla carnea TaxID=189513 RepID=UPI001D05C2C4|nr:protein turtle-like [Chrysoperla carnea]
MSNFGVSCIPPQKIVITDDAGLERTSVVGPFSEGASFVLRCDVFGGKPVPQVTWYRNDVPVSSSKATTTILPSSSLGSSAFGSGSTRVRSELTITHLTRDDVHSELTCRASNNNKTAPLAATLHVDMNFGPLDVRILGPHQPLSAGRRYELLCQSCGSRPPASITWWRNGERLDRTKETTSSDGNTTTSTLSFIASKEDAGKYLSCRAENPVVNADGLEDGWRLEIQYTPEAKIILGTNLNPDNIREGTDVYFDCLINAHPNVYKVEWRHNGRILNHNVGLGIIISNQSLVLQGVSRATAGNYTCVGFNTEGDGESNIFYLNVLFAPTCKPKQTKVHGIAKQEKAQIMCEVEANPSDVTFRWTFNNSAESIDVAVSHISRVGTTSIVSYTPMTELDYGTLLCWATNRIGHQRVPCVYHIIAAGRPDQVHNCSIAYISMTSFAVRCNEGFNGGLPQSFMLEVRESHTQEMRANMTSPVARFNVTNGLEPGAHYQAAVYAYNPKGKAEPVILQAATLRLPEKQLTSEKDRPRNGFRFTPMMSVLIGVISALLIVALVVIIVLRFQCTQTADGRRNKRHKVQRNAGGSPISKHDSSAGDGNESDEKNPDIIPQPVDSDEQTDFLRKRQHISTIETSSPTRSLLHQQPGGANGPSGYMGYCTLRNGMPIQEYPQQKMHVTPGGVMSGSFPGGGCTLPRQHWPTYSGAIAGVRHLQAVPTGIYPLQAQCRPSPVQHTMPMPRVPPIAAPRAEQPPIPLQPLSSEEEPTVDTPLMVKKRESSV